MHLLGTIAMILVLSLMIAGLLKLNYKDLWAGCRFGGCCRKGRTYRRFRT